MKLPRFGSGPARLGMSAALALCMFACSARVAIDANHDGGGTNGEPDANGVSTPGSDGGAAPQVDGGSAPGPDASTGPGTLAEVAPVIRTAAVSKVDILFDVDNSASMADKQSYLARAIPDLVGRLIDPNCVDPTQGVVVGKSANGVCASGRLEFPPVHDMHLGMVTSSLGSRLSETASGVCNPAATAPQPFSNLSAHNDDQAHLVARSLTFSADGSLATEGAVTAASPSDYLYWFPGNASPTGPVQPETAEGSLIGDFTSMVNGAGIFGCGIESQLESWYRFLVQPDPYASLQPSGGGVTPAQMWQGVDATILQQRRDFLRPDSAVVIVVLTDENDSEVDVRSLGGQGYFFMRTSFQPPRGTSQCLTNPADPGCVSCSVNLTDPNCAQGNYKAPNDWGFDMNLRHVHMKAKYGLDPQYPIQRYVIGLTSPVVPDRFGEYTDANGNSTNNYLGRNDCTNPLFAASLPDGSQLDPGHLCNLPMGPRTRDLVTYAVIGGVPNQLLHYLPGDELRSALTAADWIRILGVDPLNFRYNGIDPHMIEDFRDRTTVQYPFATDSSMTNPLQPSGASSMADAVNGREWITDQEMTPNTHVLRVDRQYACTFPLVTPRDCTLPQNGNSCDCPATAGGLTPAQTPPICNGTTQVAAKAYPTTRELLLADLLGSQSVVGSICPIHVTDENAGSDPLYGYRPTMALIGDRLRGALGGACLPQALPSQAGGGAACMVLVQLPASSGGSCLQPVCDSTQGFVAPDASTSATLCANEEQIFDASGGAASGLADPAQSSLCVLRQLADVTGTNTATILHDPADFDASGSCTSSGDKGWCYVSGSAAGACNQALAFAPGAIPAGVTAHLYCGAGG